MRLRRSCVLRVCCDCSNKRSPSYVVGINEQNALQNQYRGKKITRDQDFVPARAEEPYPLESTESLPHTASQRGWAFANWNDTRRSSDEFLHISFWSSDT